MAASLKVHLIAGARPNFMKVAPLWHALARTTWCAPALVHTGQHYDDALSGRLLEELGLPHPHHALGVGSGSHAEQTAKVMIGYERVLEEAPADLAVVVGDVNSTLAAALVAVKRGVAVAHLEAGLRSGDRAMPEEINRIVTDSVADILWTPSPDGDENLVREGVSKTRITRVGNIMIDAFELMRPRIAADETVRHLRLAEGRYGVVTLHRPSNVDDVAQLTAIVDALCRIAQELPLVFPAHPRTRAQLAQAKLDDRLVGGGVTLIDPLGYVGFMRLVTGSRVVVTDSGGVQEETSYLGIPCLTLRATTERPITVTHGTNRLVAADTLLAAMASAAPRRRPSAIPLWDGATASRVVADIAHRFAVGRHAA